MRRSANLSAEKIGLDYLGRVSSAAQRILPKGDRLLFVGRTRAAIEKRCGPLAKADPAKLLEVIAELGDPQTMVKKELERLETAHRGGPPPPVVMWKPSKDEQKPPTDDWNTTKADTEPIPRQPGSPPPGTPPPGTPPPGTPTAATPTAASAEPTTDQPDEIPPPVAPAPSPPSVRALVRSHPLETVAVLVLGVGGLIVPLVWLAGALIAVASRIWDARDKWLALLGPPLFVLAGLVAAGVLVGGRHGFFGEFIHAFNAYREYLIRAGAVLSAAYLAWRVRRGPRMRSLPPWQRPQRGPRQ